MLNMGRKELTVQNLKGLLLQFLGSVEGNKED